MDTNAGDRHCRSRVKKTRSSSPTQRATKRDRSRTTRPPLSPRIDEFARQLQQHESTDSTSTGKPTTSGAASQRSITAVAREAVVTQPSTSTQQSETRHSSSATTARGRSPVFRAPNVKKKTCNVCGEVMLARNWIRHLERCHKNAAAAASTTVTSGDQLEQVAQVGRARRRHESVDAARKRHHLRRCISLIYPYACLELPTAVQMSYAKHAIPGMSYYDRSICVTTVGLLMSKFKDEMRFARSRMETRHFCKPRSKSVQPCPDTGSTVGVHIQPVEVEVHRDPIIPDDASVIADSASLFSVTENVELLESIRPDVELPQLSGDDVLRNVPTVELTEMKQPRVPYEVIRQRYKVKRVPRPSATATAGQLVEHRRGNVAETQAATEPVPTTPQPTVAAHTSNPPEPSRVTHQRATSPAARVRSWQHDAGERGGSGPRYTRRSSRSRSPAREGHGYQRRDLPRHHFFRSPWRVERRPSPKSSPPRYSQYARGRDDTRRDDRPRDREPPDPDRQLVAEILNAFRRRRE